LREYEAQPPGPAVANVNYMKDLAGKTAVVTGGASGIGLAMGEAFAKRGMNVVLADIEAGRCTKRRNGSAPSPFVPM
jgi:nucleoside-diphosphate-sugar epimerase